jgi:hypothetical protein
MKNLFLLPIRFCTSILYKMFDWLFSAMRMSALNWLKIGRRAADAGLDVAQSAKTHAKELSRRIDEKKE